MTPERLSSEHSLDAEWPECALGKSEHCERFTKEELRMEAGLERMPRWNLVSESCRGQSVKRAFRRRCKCNQRVIQRGANEFLYKLLTARWEMGRSGGVALKMSSIPTPWELALEHFFLFNLGWQHQKCFDSVFCDISDMVELLFTRRSLAVLLAVFLWSGTVESSFIWQISRKLQ